MRFARRVFVIASVQRRPTVRYLPSPAEQELLPTFLSFDYESLLDLSTITHSFVSCSLGNFLLHEKYALQHRSYRQTFSNNGLHPSSLNSPASSPSYRPSSEHCTTFTFSSTHQSLLWIVQTHDVHQNVPTFSSLSSGLS